jgi:hypothetical protein
LHFSLYISGYQTEDKRFWTKWWQAFIEFITLLIL